MHNTAKPEQIKAEAQILADKLYLYGTDYMSTGEIKNYFVHFPSIRVTWINDSSCIIGFSSESEAETAFFKYSIKPLEDQPLETENLEGEEKMDID